MQGNRRSPGAGLFAIGASALAMAALPYLQSCDEQNDPPIVYGGTCDGEVCASAAERCKSRLKNYRHRYLPAPVNAEMYTAGTRTKWCWRGGEITMRHTDMYKVPTSPVGTVTVDGNVWSSDCGPYSVPASCLVRVEFWAVLQVSIGPFTLNGGEYTCVGTRIYAGGAHTRNISQHQCPGSQAAEADLTARILGLPGDAIPDRLERRIALLAFSPDNLRHMKRTGRPLPKLVQLAERTYRQLPPDEQAKLALVARPR